MFLEGTDQFSNPVSDFYPYGATEYQGGQECNGYLKEIHDFCNEMTDGISKDVEALDDHGKQVSKHVAGLSLNQGKTVGNLYNIFAKRIKDFESGFQKSSEDYEKSIANPQGDLGFVISRYLCDHREANSAIEFLKASLLVNSSRLIQLARRLENIPVNMYLHGFAGQRLYLADVCNQAGAEIRALAEKIDKTTASISKALENNA